MNLRGTTIGTAVLLLLGTISIAHAQSVNRGPYLQSGAPSSITVKWRTDVATDAVVRYGTNVSNLNLSAQSGSTDTNHEVVLNTLQDDTRYFYSIGNSAGALAGGDSSYTFVTSPLAGTSKPTRIWVIGDSGTADANAAAVRDAYASFTGARGTELWLMLGDNAYPDGTDSQYQSAVFNMYPEMLRQTVLWPTLGNHDGHTADSATQSGPYYDIFSLPKNGEAGGLASGTEAYYSFDYGNIHFISLESYETDRSPGGAMFTWLQNDVAATNKEWVIAIWHHPPYTKGSHDSDTEGRLIDMRTNALPILEFGGVDLVMTGHSHSYERSFLIDGHYGSSSTFDSSMQINAGSGREDDTGAYSKLAGAGTPHQGAVYAVAGSSGKTSGGPLNHPAMFVSVNSLGSIVVDVDASRMDVTFINQAGSVVDYFTMLKGPDTSPPALLSADALNDTSVSAVFSETLDTASAELTGNYSIDQGVNITAASLSVDNRTVILTTSQLQENVNYTLSVSNVEDVAGNVIAPNSQASFVLLPTPSVHVEDIAMQLGNNGPNWLRATAVVLVQDANGQAVSNATVSATWSGLTTESASGLTAGDGTVDFRSSKSNSSIVGEFIFTVSNVTASGFDYDAGANVESSDCIDTSGAGCGGSGGPPAPTGLSATADSSTITLDWTASSDPNVVTYGVYRSTSSGGAYSQLATVASPGYVDTQVTPDVPYYYVVTAIDNGEAESPFSNEASATVVSGGSVVLSVSDVSVSLQRTGRNWRGRATVSVVDDSGAAVADASVTADWVVELASGGDVALGTTVGQTSGDGTVLLTSAKYRANSGDIFRATVTDVSKGGAVYDPGPVAPSGMATVP